jgi:hypothetical protein
VPVVSRAGRAVDAPFVPLRARRTAIAVAVAQGVVLVGLAVLMPGTGVVAFHWYDRLGVVIISALVALVLSMFARLRAEPREHTLVVRNLVHRRELAWAQVVAVRFGGGSPWVTLDLDDGDVLAVMAVQRADGARGEAEARRLATLVAVHSATSTDD